MALCDFCKSAELVGGTCPNCGRILCNFQECHIISGTKPSTELARISLTDKYMMLYIRGTGKTVAAASFGLLGALAANALSSGTRYGFYDFKEIEKVIYPFRNSKFKKDNALKIVNKDGSDMIIKQVIGAVSMDKIAACFKAGGVAIDSSCVDYGKVFCAKPFVDKKTMASRICPSAAPFVKPVKGNFLAESVSGQTVNEPTPAPVPTPEAVPTPSVPTSTPEPVPTPEPVQTVKAESIKTEQPEVVYVPSVEAKLEEKQVINEPVVSQPIQETPPAPMPVSMPTPPPVQQAPSVQPTQPAFKFCYNCGNKIAYNDNFCFKCGARQ